MNFEPLSEQEEQITKKIVDAAYTVEKALGPGLEEKERSFLISGGDVIGPNVLFNGTDVLVIDGRIEALGRHIEKDERTKEPKNQRTKEPENSASHGVPVIDAHGKWVAPGLIDMHIHGVRGMLLGVGSGGGRRREKALREAPRRGSEAPRSGRYAAEEEIRGQVSALASVLPAHGVTAFVPTFVSLPEGVLASGLSAVAQCLEDEGRSRGIGKPVAKILGCHLEGPFLNPKWRGAHSLRNLRKPSVKELRRMLRCGRGSLLVLTLAPEIGGAMRVVEEARACGVVVAASHSDASFAEVEAAVKHGLRHICHLFNGMRRPNHREPGIVEAGLLLDSLTCELICDGAHVSREAIEIALRCKGTGGLVLVSDATALGAGRGPVFIGEKEYAVSRGALREVSSGRLRGGVLSVLAGVRNVHKWMQLSISEVFRTCSLNPARVLGVDARKGSIEVGKDADLLILTKDLVLEAALVEGSPAYGSFA